MTNLGHTKIYFVDGARTHPEAGGDGTRVGLVMMEDYSITVFWLSPRDITETYYIIMIYIIN